VVTLIPEEELIKTGLLEGDLNSRRRRKAEEEEGKCLSFPYVFKTRARREKGVLSKERGCGGSPNATPRPTEDKGRIGGMGPAIKPLPPRRGGMLSSDSNSCKRTFSPAQSGDLTGRGLKGSEKETVGEKHHNISGKAT